MSLGGKFQAKSSGWDENRVFLEGDILEVAVLNGRWVLTHVPGGPGGNLSGLSRQDLARYKVKLVDWRACNEQQQLDLAGV
jgi:hypothetical protein